MSKSFVRYFLVVVSLFSFACQKQTSKTGTPNPTSLQFTQEEIKKASSDLESAARTIRGESADIPLVDLSPDSSRFTSLSSRFSCESAKRAATASSEVYPITLGLVSPAELQARHRAEHFAVFNAVTGGAVHSPAPRGFVEYIPSELEVALENTPSDVDIDFAKLNTHRDAFVVFRGTVGEFNGPDWLTNRDMATGQASRMHPEAVGQIHHGFLEAYLSAQTELRSYFTESFVRKSQRLEQLLRQRLSSKGLYTQSSIDVYVRAVMDNYQVVITGHSLGGALATLAAYDFALQFALNREKLTLITFAAPASLYTRAPGAPQQQSLYQFAHLMDRGTQYGNQYSAVFFEREGDIVPRATARENYYSISPVGRYLYNGNSHQFNGRPENSGLRVGIHAVPGAEGISAWVQRVAVAIATIGIVNPDFLAAHSMNGYRDDIHAYCDEMSQRQKCLNYDGLEVAEQLACDALGMDRATSNRYFGELQGVSRVHIMDHPDFRNIRHYPRPGSSPAP